MEIRASLPTKVRPDWDLTEAALVQMVADLPGRPVRMDFKGDSIGTVLAAQRDDAGIEVTLEIARPDADALAFAPMLHGPPVHPQDPRIAAGVDAHLEMGPEWRCVAVGAYQPRRVDG